MKKYVEFLKEEVGLRNISKLAKLHKTAEIYFHKDLDGVTSALAMKEFLKNYYQIETVDCHIIQYGGLEYAIKHHQPDNLAVLVDFAHGKPMFHIQSDHHDSQVGAEDTKSTYFKPARSNVEIISGEISYNDIFTDTDLKLIKTIDSADFFRNNIKPEDVQDSIFQYKRAESAEKNRYLMGFVVNRLLLAYKNKRISVKSLDGKRNHINKNILECLVLDSTASLYSIFNNIRNYINNAKTSDRLGRLATPEEIKENLTKYIDRMKDYSFVEDPEGETHEISSTELNVLKVINNKKESELTELAKQLNISMQDLEKYIERLKDKKYLFWSDRNSNYFVGNFGKKVLQGNKAIKGVHMDDKYNILIQYGGGNMFAPGSYDRYTPFKNYPEAEFLCIVWPMGLIQVSCNPFKEKVLKDVNLGEMAKEVLAKHEPLLSKFYVALESIKYEFETSQDWKAMQKAEGEDYEGVGFKYSDLEAFYSDCVYKKEGDKIVNFDINTNRVINAMNTVYDNLSRDQKELLASLKIPVWEIIKRNSGGHPSITNISGLNFLKYNKKALQKFYNTDKYVDVLKKLARELVNNLKEKIDTAKKGEEVKYDTGGVELLGHDINESFNFNLTDKNGNVRSVSKDSFLKAGAKKAMKEVKIDTINKKVIAKFENFILEKREKILLNDQEMWLDKESIENKGANKFNAMVYNSEDSNDGVEFLDIHGDKILYFLKKTDDNWYGNVNGDSVEITLHYIKAPALLKDGKKFWKISCWGNDDYGIFKDFFSSKEAMDTFFELKKLPKVNKQYLFDRGFEVF